MVTFTAHKKSGGFRNYLSFRSHHPGWRGAGWWEGAPLPGGGQQSTLCVPVLMKSDTAKAPGVVCQLQTQRALPNPSSLSALPCPPTASSIPLLISLPAQLTDTNAQPSFSKAWTGQALCLFSVDLPKAGISGHIGADRTSIQKEKLM